MLEEIKRRAAADPQNATLALNVVTAMARGNRGGELLEVLKDREGWNKASEGAQYLAGLEVARRLGLDWEFKGMRVWECENKRPCETCEGTGMIREDTYWDNEDHPAHKLLDKSDMCPDCFCKTGERYVAKTISHRLALYIHKPTGMEFNLLPGWEYVEWVGRDRGAVEGLIKPFLIARWPVTHGQIIKRASLDISGREDYFNKAGDEDLPYTGLSFDFLKEHLPKVGFELPTPEQWEYARLF